jgi:hypothetical protein
MNLFIPCQGKSACRDDGRRCLTCGRELREIEQLRLLVDRLAVLAIDYHYENVEEFAAYVAGKLGKMITYRRQTKSV